MRFSMLILLILPACVAFAQTEKISVKLNLLPLLDDVTFPTIQAGIECNLSKRLSWYNEFGIKYRMPQYEHTDSIFLASRGWKTKTEFRYYSQQTGRLKFARAYIGANAFVTNNQYNTQIGYYQNNDSSTIKKDGFGVKKTVFGLNLIFGFQKNYSKRIAADIYGGLGMRCRNISTTNKEFDKKRDSYTGTSVDVNAWDLRNRADGEAGYSVLPNLTLGIRICYRLK